MTPLRIFVGFDSREAIAYHVLCHSILTRSSIPVQFCPLYQPALRSSGLYTRERGPTESTEFSLTRFLVPYLSAYEGISVFMDCDMLCRMDFAQVLSQAEREGLCWSALVAKHEYVPRAAAKFLGQPQTSYPCKNWSSFIVFNNCRCARLTPEYVNSAPALDLHRFLWAEDRIGELPLTWNWLIGEYEPNPAAEILHYTNGGPWFADCKGTDHADDWDAERRVAIGVDE